MNWLTYVWAVAMCCAVGLGVWFASESIYRRLHFNDNRNTCREQNGAVIEYGGTNGFMCVYNARRSEFDSPKR